MRRSIMKRSAIITSSWHWLVVADADDEKPIVVADIDRAPDNIPAQAPQRPHTHQEYADLLQKFRDLSNENTRLEEEILQLRRINKTSEILDALIKPFADKAYKFMCAYCGFVGIVLLLEGFFENVFDLPDSAIDFLVGSTAVTVIGLVGMVLTGVFVGARKR